MMWRLDDLIGCWSLQSWRLFKNDSEISSAFGREPLGRLFYSDTGFMGAHLRWDDGARDMSYSGRFTLSDRVRHHVDFSSDPAWIGRVVERTMRFDGAALILATPPERGRSGAEYVQRLTWQRLTPAKPA